MVLAQAVGRPRPYWQGFWLAVATLGFYGFYWDYRTHMELYQQFELRREWREDGGLWYVLAFLFWILRFVYYYHYTANLQYLMQRMGHRAPPTPAGILGLKIPATVALFTVLPVGLSLVATQFVFADPFLLALGIVLSAGAIVTWTVLKAIAYHRLQRSVNWVWAMYDHRMRELRQGAPPAPRPAVAAPAPSAPSTVAGTGSAWPRAPPSPPEGAWR